MNSDCYKLVDFNVPNIKIYDSLKSSLYNVFNDMWGGTRDNVIQYLKTIIDDSQIDKIFLDQDIEPSEYPEYAQAYLDQILRLTDDGDIMVFFPTLTPAKKILDNNMWKVYNASTGKVLKSILYKPVNFKLKYKLEQKIFDNYKDVYDEQMKTITTFA